MFAGPAGGLTYTEIAPPPANNAEVLVRVRENGAVTSEQRRNVPVGDLRPNGSGCPPKCVLVEILVDEGGFA